MTDPNHVFFNFGVGGWLYRSDERSGLTGIVPMMEIHHTNSLDRGDIVTAGPFEIGNFDGTVSLTSAVVGTTFEFGQLSNLTVGYATPLTGGVGRQYDGALRIMYSRVLGR